MAVKYIANPAQLAISLDGVDIASAFGAGSEFALSLPQNGSPVVTWQTIFSAAPSTVTVDLEASQDGTTWSIIDTSTSTAGEIRTISGSYKFLRLNNSAVTGGAGKTLTAEFVYTNQTTIAATQVAAGSDTQVQFNDGGILGGNAALTFDKSGSGDGIVIFRKTMSGASATSNYFSVTGTLPTVPTVAPRGALFSFTTAGSNTLARIGLRVDMLAGYTGTSSVAAATFSSSTDGIANLWNANVALNAQSASAGTLSVGVHGTGGGTPTVAAFGVVGRTNTAANVKVAGIVGIAQSTSTITNATGGIFLIDETSSSATQDVPTNASDFILGKSALSASNKTTTNPIFRLYDNTTEIFKIDDGAIVNLLGLSTLFGDLASVDAETGTTLTTTAAQSGQVITNTGNGGSLAITLLNNPTIGVHYSVVVTAAQSISVAPSAGETLYFNGTSAASVSSSTVGHALSVVAVTGGSGAIWVATGVGFA